MKVFFKPKRLLLLAGIYLALCALGGIVVGEGAVRPPRRRVTEAAIQRAEKIAADAGGRLEWVEVQAGDGVTLRAWLFAPAAERRTGDAVMLLHGVADSRITQTGFVAFLMARGYAVLIPDARAHGESGGEMATYGVRERQDIHAWEQLLRQRLAAADGTAPAGSASQTAMASAAPRPCIYGIAHSLGAAILLQSLDEQSAMCAVVAEESFASFKEVAFDRLSQPFGAPHWLGRTAFRPLVESGILYLRMGYGVNLGEASPAVAVAGARVPILLIHGVNDDNIPIRHAAMLRAANPRIQFWAAPNVGHWSASSDYPEEYRRRVLEWFAAHREPGGAAAGN